MTIKHTTVDAAKTYSADYRDMREGVSHEQHTKPQLYEFVRAVEKTLRVKTIPRCDKTVHVYREGDLMTMGYIGYGDFATSVHSDDKFIVCARGVQNMKYNSHTDQHNMRMAVNMDTAVKHAKRHIVSYTVGECATALMGGAADEIHTLKNAVRNKYDDAIQKVGLDSHYSAKKKTARIRPKSRDLSVGFILLVQQNTNKWRAFQPCLLLIVKFTFSKINSEIFINKDWNSVRMTPKAISCSHLKVSV